LENFFGLVHRQSFGDDRSVTAAQMIARSVLVANVMHHRRDNVGGVVISGSSPEFADEAADRLFRSLVILSSLEHYPIDRRDLFSRQDMQTIICEWSANDQHHYQDEAYRMDFPGKIAGSRIAARNRPAKWTPESES
jgi:hypothetical protein